MCNYLGCSLFNAKDKCLVEGPFEFRVIDESHDVTSHIPKGYYRAFITMNTYINTNIIEIYNSIVEMRKEETKIQNSKFCSLQ